jgi:hypothetical protein
MEHREQIIGGVARRAEAKPGVETRKHIHRETPLMDSLQPGKRA